MSDPYRAPEIPAGTEADRRLDQRITDLAEAGAREREAAARRTRRIRRALVGAALFGALYTFAGVVLECTLLTHSRFLAATVLASAIATPMALFFAIGLKVPPAPGDPSGGMPNRHP